MVAEEPEQEPVAFAVVVVLAVVAAEAFVASAVAAFAVEGPFAPSADHPVVGVASEAAASDQVASDDVDGRLEPVVPGVAAIGIVAIATAGVVELSFDSAAKSRQDSLVVQDSSDQP